MLVIDPPPLHSEALPPPVSRLRRLRRTVVWVGLLAGTAAAIMVLALHLLPASGAAGGCGGG